MLKLAVNPFAVAVEQATKRLVDDLYDEGKKVLGASRTRWITSAKLKRLGDRVKEVRRVRTLYTGDNAIDLLKFYRPPIIEYEGKEQRVVAIKHLPKVNRLLVEGVAGQGKTVFLRYLCSRFLIDGITVPIFIELRRLTKTSSLTERVEAVLGVYGFPDDRKVLQFLASKGRLTLILDGADEVESEISGKVFDEIEQFALKYPECKFIVSSRPQNRFSSSRHFARCELQRLSRSELIRVVNILVPKTDERKPSLMKSIKDPHNANVLKVVDTPLLVVLLLLTFKFRGFVPLDLSSFYSQLFHVLWERHDVLKIGLKREVQSELYYPEMHEAFTAFCFESRKLQKHDFSVDEAYKIARVAVANCQLNTSPKAFVDDIANVTNLLIRDGNRIEFAHKSIQEYHAAVFISNTPDIAGIERRFTKLRRCGKWRSWAAEIDYLRKLSRYHFAKHFLVPAIKAFLAEVFGREVKRCPSEISKGAAKKLTALFRVNLSRGKVANRWTVDLVSMDRSFVDRDPEGVSWVLSIQLMDRFDGKKISHIVDHIHRRRAPAKFQPDSSNLVYSSGADELLGLDSSWDQGLKKAAKATLRVLFEMLDTQQRFVESTEKISLDNDL